MSLMSGEVRRCQRVSPSLFPIDSTRNDWYASHMVKGKRENISIYLKEEDRDVETWLEGLRADIKESTGISVKLGPIVIAQLRRVMKNGKQ